MTGGDCGASNWAQTVYGSAANQHPVSANNHTIAMNNPENGLILKGGALAPLAPSELGSVPAVALVKGGDGEVSVVPVAVNPETLPVVVDNASDSASAADPSLAEPAAGGSIITDIALPAVLLYARDSIRKRRFVGLPSMSMKKGKGYRRSRRGSRRGRGRR
jgi:hypothetical protein